MLLWLIIFILIIPFIMMLLNSLISKKEWLDREKITSFECGFDSMSSSRLPFSIHFYLIGNLFLIFDVEIVYLFPILDLYYNLSFFEWMFLSSMVIFILYIGLEFEKKEGSLKWFM